MVENALFVTKVNVSSCNCWRVQAHVTSQGAAGSVRMKRRGLRNEPATTGTIICEVSWKTAVLLCWTRTNAVPFHATTLTETPGNNTPKTPVRLLYTPEAQTANIYKKRTAKNSTTLVSVFETEGEKQNDPKQVHDWDGGQLIVLFDIDWKISGIMIKV